MGSGHIHPIESGQSVGRLPPSRATSIFQGHSPHGVATLLVDWQRTTRPSSRRKSRPVQRQSPSILIHETSGLHSCVHYGASDRVRTEAQQGFRPSSSQTHSWRLEGKRAPRLDQGEPQDSIPPSGEWQRPASEEGAC